MSAPLDEESKAKLDERLKRVREIEDKLRSGSQAEPQLRGWRGVFVVLSCATLVVFEIGVTATSPIPRGKENRELAAGFLNEHFPDRVLSPNAKDSSTAPVAAVFHIIRHGAPGDATLAIDFAAQQEFGNASPYVIERLASDDPRLRLAAESFLRQISGRDYGPDPAPWNDWWNNPERTLFGIVTLGQKTLQLGIPVAAMLIGLTCLIGGTVWKRDLGGVIGTALFILGWFLFIGYLGMRLVGSFDTCTFGGTEIVYHQGHGVVEGLQDARVGGAGLWLLLCLTYVAVPFVLVMIWLIVLSIFPGQTFDASPRKAKVDQEPP